MSLWSAPVYAQNVDLASVGAQYMPSAKMAGAPGSVQVSSYDVAVNVPVPVGPKTFFVPGATYHMDAVSFADTPPEFVQLRAFQSVDVSTLMVRLLPNNWSFASRVSMGLAGDFASVDERMLRASTMMTATHAFSKRFVLGGGGLTTFSFGSFLALPAIYVDWKPFDGAELEAFLPAFVHARYTLWNRVRFGVLGDFNGNEYAVRDERIRNACTRPSECFDNMAYSVGTAGLSLGVRLVSSVWLNGFFGHSFFRRLDRRNSARDLLEGGRDDIPNVAVIRVALVWRLPGID